jgi:outer membrane protein OmpA-like peptidoglycan-associated protein
MIKNGLKMIIRSILLLFSTSCLLLSACTTPEHMQRNQDTGELLIENPQAMHLYAPHSKAQTLAKQLQQAYKKTDLAIIPIGNQIEMILPSDELFGVNNTHLQDSMHLFLNNMIHIIKHYPELTINIYGFTDQRGSKQRNIKLSEQRAYAIAEYFIQQGLNPKHIEAQGFGNVAPIADNGTTQGRAKNRRIVINLSFAAKDEV